MVRERHEIGRPFPLAGGLLIGLANGTLGGRIVVAGSSPGCPGSDLGAATDPALRGR
jgi:hypothetical protein